MKINMILYILLGLCVFALLGIFYLYTTSQPITESHPIKTIKAKIQNENYNLEVVATPETLQKGLMNREELDRDEGMLFVFERTSIYPFWMKNTLIPLDMIWINKEKEVVHIKENAQPCSSTVEAICKSIVPLKPALYVIELNAGEVEKLGLKTGDKVEFEINGAN